MKVHSSSIKRLVFAGWLGTLLEWYDFAIYGFLAPVFAGSFFPSNREWLRLLLVYSVFSVGYLIRPLGGWLFGSLGDRKGRKSIFIYTILCMSLPTTMIGILPTYAVIGWLAPVLLIGLRLMQGLAAGGEMIGSVVFIYESVPERRQAFYTTLLFVGSGFGILLGSTILSFFHYYYSAQAMQEFVWRIPFLLAIIGLLISLWLRHGTVESREFLVIKQQGATLAQPCKKIWQSHKVLLLRVACLFSPGALLFYLNFVFLPVSVSEFLGASQSNIMLLNTIATIVLLVASVGFAMLADYYSKRRFVIVALVMLLCVVIPIYSWMFAVSVAVWFVCQLLLAIIIACLTGPLMAYILQLVPVEARYSSVAITYNLAYSLIGGTAPLVAISLLHAHFYPLWLGLYAMVVVCLALIAALNPFHFSNIRS